MLTVQSNKRRKLAGARTFGQKFFQVPFRFLLGMWAFCSLFLTQPPPAFAEMRSSPTMTSSSLEIPSPDNAGKLTFTLYKVNSVQYFSAGVGVEERNASYPPYPLKLIFVQGERAFLAGVNISIAKSDGTHVIDIPHDHVVGPWLFVAIPTGTYTITGTDSRQRILNKEVRVGEEGTRVVHFRWLQ